MPHSSMRCAATAGAKPCISVAPRSNVSGSIEYRINKYVTLHASGQNLTGSLWRNVTYAPGSPEYTRPTQYRDTGIAYVIGMKGEF